MPGPDPDAPIVSVPEIRDYGKINPALVALLNAGHRRVCLAGVEGQRLLVAGLKGPWDAVIEVQGRAGPELAADLNAPHLRVVCQGSAADGAGRGMLAGRLLILGDASEAVGYAQSGGAIVVAGKAGHRAGLNRSGGTLIIRGDVGRLAGERQSGGLIAVARGILGPYPGRARRGGRIVHLVKDEHRLDPRTPDDLDAVRSAMDGLAPWLTIEDLGGVEA